MPRPTFDADGLLRGLAGGLAAPVSAEPDLLEFADFGADPGDLRMLMQVPEGLAPGAPLVVVLHGCGQAAAGYAAGAGWMELARRHGFALLLPEQRRANNPGLCFDWFQPADTARGAGEVGSIRSMVEYALATHHLDRRRVFVTGLSAGGAMTSALLATYPEVFAGGAIIAGLPYGCAATVHEAFEAMRGGVSRPAREWGDKVRAASAHAGPWPRVSVWHGSADRTVRPTNAVQIVRQWVNVHGLNAAPGVEDRVDGALHRLWRDSEGTDCVEVYFIPGMDHGTPIAPAAHDPEQRCGAAGPFLLDVGLSSSYRMAQAWQLLRGAEETRSGPAPAPVRRTLDPALAQGAFHRTPAPRRIDPGAVINAALRGAGLLRDG